MAILPRPAYYRVTERRGSGRSLVDWGPTRRSPAEPVGHRGCAGGTAAEKRMNPWSAAPARGLEKQPLLGRGDQAPGALDGVHADRDCVDARAHEDLRVLGVH
jgi:hypothetical protein